jgi:murein DD-endopeptidase MepM/ murein hydrolase activator NlpD
MSENLNLIGSTVRQGGLIVARLTRPPDGLTSAQLNFNGGSYGMVPDPAIGGAWVTYVGLPISFAPGVYPIEVRGGDSSVLASGYLNVTSGGFDYTEITFPPGPAGLLGDPARVEAERIRVANILAGFTPRRYWSGPWITPAAGTVSSNFGEHRSINGAAYFPHSGHDIANSEGTPVYASATGVVAMAEELYLYGNSILIDHGLGVFSGYSHLQQMLVAPGQTVNQGDLIGYMGTTGFSSGPHLHWEAAIRGVRVDPRHFLPNGVAP